METSHQFVLKKNEPLRIKCDTYVLETNVHFPTDLNLLWDALRKGLDVMGYCKKHYRLGGWRKLSFWRSSLKSQMRACGKACASTSKNKDEQIRIKVEEYLRLAKEMDKKATQSVAHLWSNPPLWTPLLLASLKNCFIINK